MRRSPSISTAAPATARPSPTRSATTGAAGRWRPAEGPRFGGRARPAARDGQRLRDGWQLRRLYDELDRGRCPDSSSAWSSTMASSTPARWPTRPRNCGSTNGSTAAIPITRRRRVREMEPGQLRHKWKTPQLVDHKRERFPHPLHAGDRRVHRASAPQHSVAPAGLPRREPLGAEAEELGAVVRRGVRLDGPLDGAGRAGAGGCAWRRGGAEPDGAGGVSCSRHIG